MMAEDFIKEIYDLAKIIPETKKMIKWCQNHSTALVIGRWNEYGDLFSKFCHTYIEIDKEKAVALWKEMQEIYSANKGVAYMGSRLEESILPKLFDAMQNYGGIDVTEGKYRLFSSKSGYLSIQNIECGEYICSLIDPISEAYELAEKLYKPKQKSFYIMGGGLGYLAKALYEISEESLQIYIFEKDEAMMQYGYAYGVLDEIPSECMHFVYDTNPEKLLDRFFDYTAEKGNILTGRYIENWWTLDLPEQEKNRVSKFTTIEATNRIYQTISELNFWRNISNVQKYIKDVQLPNKHDEWIVVAAGPSLDEQIDFLRNSKGNEIIICATTCYNKLINAGVIPDFVAVADFQNRTYGHFENITCQDVPLFVGANANWKFAENYEGDKYIVPHLGALSSYEYYEQNNITPWNVGGTVTSMAIEIAVGLGAKKIKLVGVDLAYPSNKSHAAGLMDTTQIDVEGMILVQSVDGGKVYTSEEFIMYIDDIERIIEKNKDITFINMSKHGALIKGAKSNK